MFTEEFLKAWFKNALTKGAQAGGLALVEEILESLPIPQLETLKKTADRILERKKNVVDHGVQR